MAGREDDYGAGARDAVEVCRKIVEVAELGGGNLVSVRVRVEQLWCELQFAGNGIIEEEDDGMKIRSNGDTSAVRRLRDAEARAAEVAAGRHRAQAEVERWAATGLVAARAVDEARVAVLAAHAVTVRGQASGRREAAVQAGATVEDVEVVRLDASGSTMELQRRYVSDRIAGEAAVLEQRADALEAAAVSYRDVLLGEPPAAEPEPEFRSPDARESWRDDQARKARRREAAVVGQREQLATTVAGIVEEESSS